MKHRISSSSIPVLYALLLSVLLFWYGCSSDSDATSKTEEPPNTPTPSIPDPDPDPDPPERLPEARKVPTKVRKNLPDELAEKRDRLAQNYCWSQSAKLPEMMGLVACRVKEQNEWLKNSDLYNSNHTSSCKTQTNYLLNEILRFDGDKGTGTTWLKNACKAVADKLFTNKVVNEFNEDGSIPSFATLRRKFEELLKTSSDFQSSDDSKTTISNINLMLAYSIFRLNHNCAAAMKTGNFISKITAEAHKGSLAA
ncbi:MAG: hypothetical protein OXC44_08010, partial [Proteobacteria bacterium]|nr:hypothetical protein [Pseudomonadota bacterium]